MTELGIELNDTSVELGIDPSAEAISYNGLVNKPQINSVTLQGNKTSSDLGLVDEDTLDNYYTKTQVDTSLNLKADKSTTYTKTETDTLLGNKVDKVSGKGLSQNDFTDTLKNKLDGIEQGAEVNVQADWNENDSTKDDFIKNKPTIPTLDNYYTKTETDSKISSHHDTTKQDTLVSGTNIKTINNNSILGSGNIQIDGGVQSVNGKTGVVVLDADDVGALPSSTAIPSKTSDLTNDSGFITSASLSPYRTSANQDVIDNTKVDKITGKGLSENDFTTTLKTKLDGISANAKNVSVSATGTSTDEVQYITIDGVEKKLAGGSVVALTTQEVDTIWENN